MSNRAIFIISPLNRSGTNFLSDIICLDERFDHSKGIGEDYLLAYSDLIDKYCRQTIRHWSRENSEVRTDAYMRTMSGIGAGLINVVRYGTPDDVTVVLKTPRPYNLKYFFDIFPDEKLIILLRDGRDTVESFHRSFKFYKFHQIAKLWSRGIEEITEFMKQNDKDSKLNNVLMIKYENLISCDQNTINNILNFCGLNELNVNTDTIKSLPLRGSSTEKGVNQNVHWKKVKKPDNFNPIRRWKSWTLFKKIIFEIIAGEAMKKAGYK